MYPVASAFVSRLSYVLALEKNVGCHKTFLNLVMESFYMEIALSEEKLP